MKNTKKAFLWIIEILKENKVPYRISGGFAARLYGVDRPLNDIDIEIPNSCFEKILPEVKQYILWGPKKYVDKNMKTYGLSINYAGQIIDLSGTESEILFDRRKRKWVKSKTNLFNVSRKKVFGSIVKVIKKKDLIGYKNKLRRKVDLEDIRQLLD